MGFEIVNVDDSEVGLFCVGQESLGRGYFEAGDAGGSLGAVDVDLLGSLLVSKENDIVPGSVDKFGCVGRFLVLDVVDVVFEVSTVAENVLGL